MAAINSANLFFDPKRSLVVSKFAHFFLSRIYLWGSREEINCVVERQRDNDNDRRRERIQIEVEMLNSTISDN